MANWDCAARVADLIGIVLANELAQPDWTETQAFAGLLLALHTFLKTAPASAPFELMELAARNCLAEIAGIA